MVATICWYSSSVESSTRARLFVPTLLTRMSSEPPHSSTTRDTSAARPPASLTSATRMCTRPACCAECSLCTASSSSAPRAVRRTDAPSCSISVTHASPRPFEPPVTTHVMSLRSQRPGISSRHSGDAASERRNTNFWSRCPR